MWDPLFAGYKNPTDTVRKVPKNQNVGVIRIRDCVSFAAVSVWLIRQNCCISK